MLQDVLLFLVVIGGLALSAAFLFTDRSRQVREIERAYDELSDCRNKSAEAYSLALAYYRQLELAGIKPISGLPKTSDVDPDTRRAHDERWLRATINEYFTVEEIEVLSSDIEIDFGVVGGDTKPLIVMRLVDVARRTGKLDELTRLVEQLRPNVE